MNPLEQKIKSLYEVILLTKNWKAQGQRIIFTNGCFDILHEGHVRYLTEAKSKGDKLIIGLNSDASVKKLKGPNRPINNEKARAVILAALAAVDLVVLFNDDTPSVLIDAILPDVLIKGGDYKPEDIVGYDTVISYGGQVLSLQYYEGNSTTQTIAKLKDQK